MSDLSCCLEHTGLVDYWGGMGDRGRGKGCAFASYDHSTTLRDLVDQWCDDARTNDYDFEDMPESIGDADIRDCILAMFNSRGLADYESGALCEWAAYCDDDRVCDSCGECIGELHSDDCEFDAGEVEPDDCQDYYDCGEWPQAIICIDWSDHPDYKPESDWTLCHRDDGQWEWGHKYGHDVGPFPDEDAAWAAMPDCPILEEQHG